MIQRILLDIDDVCNRCTEYALKWLGIPFDYSRFNEIYPVHHGYNIVDVANELLGYERFDVPSFWNMIPRTFWATVPESPEYKWLLETCENLVGREYVSFLTGPTKDPDCLAGKLEWIHNHAPEWMHRQYLVGPRKQFCAHSEALLIDDSDANVDKFREWGGQAVLVPRPWNTMHGTPTGEGIATQLESLFGQQFRWTTKPIPKN